MDDAGEAGDRAGRVARRPQRARGLPRARDLGDAHYGWRDQLLEAGRERFAGKEERQGERELRRRIAELERTLGKKTYELEIAGKALAGWE